MEIKKNIRLTGWTIMCLLLTFFCCVETPAQKKPPKKANPVTQKNRDLEPPTGTATKPGGANLKPERNSDKSDRTPRKKIIVVLDFDDVSLGTEKMKIGKQVALLLSNEFSKGGIYTIIERQRLEQVLKEQDLSTDERFDSTTAAEVGRALSASSVVLGTITEYTTKKKTIGVMGFGRFAYTAKLGLAIRLVDVNTSEVLNAVTVEGTAKEEAYNLGLGSTGTEITEELKTSLFTKAANKAVADAVTKLNPIIEKKLAQNSAAESNQTNESPGDNSASKPNSQNPLPPNPNSQNANQPNSLFPQVAKVSGTKVYLVDVGSKVKVGDLFSVVRGEPIKHPVTGKIMGIDGKEIAKLKVIEVNEGLVTTQIISGTGIREKDFVKPIK